MVAEALARMMGPYGTLKMRSQGTRIPPSPWVLILAMMLLSEEMLCSAASTSAPV